MSGKRTSPLEENHRRAVSTTLALLDELLCRIEGWAGGREDRGILYTERNNLAPSQRKTLRQTVAHLRGLILSARIELDLKATTQDALSDIWSRCAAFRQNLMEITGASLRRYGPVSRDVVHRLDALSRDLLDGLDTILDALPKAPDGDGTIAG